MLVLTRAPLERVRIRVGEVSVWVTLIEARGSRVRLGFEGPESQAAFHREEFVPESERPPRPGRSRLGKQSVPDFRPAAAEVSS